MSDAQTKDSGTLTVLIIALAIGGIVAMLAIVGILIALLLPAVQKVRGAANDMKSANNLQLIGLGFHNHANDFGALPMRAIYSKDGEPLLSWRVAILPYLEHKTLYDRFHLDEPWDSAHNKALLTEMPEVYLMPMAPANEMGMTHYQVVVGKGTMFEELKKDKGIKLMDVPDGLANTVLAMEATNPVPWTKPEDLKFDPDGPLPAVGTSGRPTFSVLFGDGSVRRLRSGNVNTDAFKTNLRRLMQRNDGQPIDFSPME